MTAILVMILVWSLALDLAVVILRSDKVTVRRAWSRR